MDVHNVIVVGNNLYPQGIKKIKQLLKRVDRSRVRITLLYVSPVIPAAYMQLPSLEQVEREQWVRAERHLVLLEKTLEIQAQEKIITSGNIEAEARRVSRQLQTPLIVYGSRSIKIILNRCVQRASLRVRQFFSQFNVGTMLCLK